MSKKDEFTSTDRKLLYKVRFSPNGEEYYVEASGAVTAHTIGVGLAYADDVRHTGADVTRATETEISDYYGDFE